MMVLEYVTEDCQKSFVDHARRSPKTFYLAGLTNFRTLVAKSDYTPVPR